jgi:hypothetical protein
MKFCRSECYRTWQCIAEKACRRCLVREVAVWRGFDCCHYLGGRHYCFTVIGSSCRSSIQAVSRLYVNFRKLCLSLWVRMSELLQERLSLKRHKQGKMAHSCYWQMYSWNYFKFRAITLVMLVLNCRERRYIERTRFWMKWRIGMPFYSVLLFEE